MEVSRLEKYNSIESARTQTFFILNNHRGDGNLVPYSQCSLRENPNFLKNFRPKKNALKGNVRLLFSFNIYHGILGLIFQVKNHYFASENCMQ
jgi:hypothetical protein